MDNLYDEVTIETVSHWGLQKSVYNQHTGNTSLLTTNQNIFFFPHETTWLPFEVVCLLGLNIRRLKCILKLGSNGKSTGRVFMRG